MQEQGGWLGRSAGLLPSSFCFVFEALEGMTADRKGGNAELYGNETPVFISEGKARQPGAQICSVKVR